MHLFYKFFCLEWDKFDCLVIVGVNTAFFPHWGVCGVAVWAYLVYVIYKIHVFFHLHILKLLKQKLKASE